MSQIAVQVPAVLTRRTDVRSGVLVAWGQVSAGVAPKCYPRRRLPGGHHALPGR